MGRASYFLMGLRGPCLGEGEGKDAVPCEDPLSLSPLLRSLGTKRGQGRRASVHKRWASAVHVHGAPWLTRQKEARLHREESESGEALAESHRAQGSLSRFGKESQGRASERRLEPSPPGSSWGRLHLGQGLCLTWVEGLSSRRGLDPSPRGRP